MATITEKEFLGRAGTEQLVATVKNLLANKADMDEITEYVDEAIAGVNETVKSYVDEAILGGAW